MDCDNVPFSGPSWQIFSPSDHLEPSSPGKPGEKNKRNVILFLDVRHYLTAPVMVSPRTLLLSEVSILAAPQIRNTTLQIDYFPSVHLTLNIHTT